MTVSSDTVDRLPLRPERTKATWLASIVLVFLFACGEGESDVFDPGSTRDLDAKLDTLAHVPLSADRTYWDRGESEARSTLLLARDGAVVSTAYLRFALEDLPDTSSIVEGRISCRVIGGSGDPVRLQLLEVAPEADDWREGTLPLEPLPLVEPFLDQTNPIIGTVGMDPLIAPSLAIPAELIRRWKNDPESNRGVALRLGLESSGFLVLYSSEAVVTDTETDGTELQVKTPELVVQRTDQDYTFEPEDDAYTAEGGTDEPGSETSLWVEQLVPYRALLLPDVGGTELRAGDTIHKAELLLHVVPGSFADTLDLSVGIYRTLADWSEDGAAPDTLDREAFATDVVTVTAESESLRFDFAPQVQRWIDGHDNFGLTLRVIGEGGNDGSFRVFSREGPAALVPYARIIWSPAPDPRWDESLREEP